MRHNINIRTQSSEARVSLLFIKLNYHIVFTNKITPELIPILKTCINKLCDIMFTLKIINLTKYNNTNNNKLNRKLTMRE